MMRHRKYKHNGALNNYLREVGRVPLLTPDEEIELGAQNPKPAMQQLANG
jgi:hypothetical protein